MIPSYGMTCLLSKRTERAFLLVIVALFTVLSLVYTFVVPAGEGVDEMLHLSYTLYIKNHLALPVVPLVARADTVLMGYHPPLYYAMAALLISPIDTGDFEQALP